MAESAVYDDIRVSGNADEGDTAPAAPVVVAADAVVDPPEVEAEESEATKAAKTLAAQKKKNDPAKRTGSIQAEIDAETARKHTAKREADAETERLADLRLQRAALEQPAPKADPEPQGPVFYTRPKPTMEQIGTTYASYEDYNEDLQDWKLDEREAKRAEADRVAGQTRFQQETAAKAQARIDKFKTDHPDYDAVVNAVMIPQGAPSALAIVEHLRHSDLGPELAYALAHDQPELHRIAHLPYGFAIAALGRLEAKYDTPRPAAADPGPAPSARDYKPAKPPIKPVGSSPVTSDDEGDPDDLSEAAVNAHIRRENAKDLKRRQR